LIAAGRLQIARVDKPNPLTGFTNEKAVKKTAFVFLLTAHPLQTAFT